MQRLGADVIGESPSARRPRAEWRDVGMVRIERGERRNGLGGGEWRGPGGGKWGMRWRDSVGAGGSRRVSRAKRERRPGEVAAAGGAAHLAGVVASHTTLPVIGVPVNATPLNGMDALLATVQMPSGIPVAAMAINGAKNAALFAVQILALADETLAKKLKEHRANLAKEVEQKAARVEEQL